MKRKLFKILLIIASSLVIIVLALALAISPVTKNYIVKHSKEMIGRKVQMRDLHINIFTGKLEVDSIRMYEANDKDVFASIDTILINLNLIKLIGKKIEISQFKVIRPYMVVLQNKDVFNFDDLMKKQNTSKEDTASSSFSKSIVIRNIFIRGGKLIYTDQALKNTIKMNDLGISIPEISFVQGNTQGGVHLKIGDIATLDSKLVVNLKTNKYKLNLSVKNLAINIFKPYILEYYNLKDLEGLMNGNLLFAGNTNHLMNFKLSGTGNVSRFKMTNGLGEPIASAETASMKMNTISYKTSTYLFDYIHASNVRLNFILKQGTNNFSAVFKPDDKSKATDSTKTTFKIKDLHIDNSQLLYVDNTLNSPFSLPINKIDFQGTNFDMDGNNEFNIKGAFPEGGNVRFNWKGKMKDLSNQKMLLNLQNLKLHLISPYCRYFTAYDITNGNMNFVSKNNIRNNNIVSSNIVDVFKPNVGKKHKELKVKYNVPLKLALYVLKDKDDKVNFDLPVKGNMKDPKFSYSKIIFKTVVNLMVKVALSPVKFLAGALGLNPDKLEAIPVDPLQTTLTAEQYSQLNDVVTMIKKKPDMVLSLTRFVDLKGELTDFALYKTKYSYLISVNDSVTQTPPDYEEVEQLNNNDVDFVEYIDSLSNVKGLANKNGSIMEKVNSLYIPDSLRTELLNKLEKQNSFLNNYMIDSYQLSKQNLIVKTANLDTLNRYKDKALYKIEMTLPEAEKPNE